MEKLLDRFITIFIDRLIKYLLDDGIPSIYHHIYDENSSELVQDNSNGHNHKGEYGE